MKTRIKFVLLFTIAVILIATCHAQSSVKLTAYEMFTSSYSERDSVWKNGPTTKLHTKIIVIEDSIYINGQKFVSMFSVGTDEETLMLALDDRNIHCTIHFLKQDDKFVLILQYKYVKWTYHILKFDSNG